MFKKRGYTDNITFLDRLTEVYDLPEYNKVRLGNANDGGYVTLLSRGSLFSIGIGNDYAFEEEYSKIVEPGGCVYCFDPYMNSLKTNRPNLYFQQIGLGINEYHDQQIYDVISKTEGIKTVKIDIEGSEWCNNVLENILCLGPEQILIELHLFLTEHNSKHSPYFTGVYNNFYDYTNGILMKKYNFEINRILNNYTLCHIHGNNSLPKIEWKEYSFPPLLELTLIRNDFIKSKTKSNNIYPVSGLDKPNKTDRPDFENLLKFKNE